MDILDTMHFPHSLQALPSPSKSESQPTPPTLVTIQGMPCTLASPLVMMQHTLMEQTCHHLPQESLSTHLENDSLDNSSIGWLCHLLHSQQHATCLLPLLHGPTSGIVWQTYDKELDADLTSKMLPSTLRHWLRPALPMCCSWSSIGHGTTSNTLLWWGPFYI